MSESTSTLTKPAENGVQGLAMMAPVVGLPLGLHALGGVVVVGACLAPIAVPAAIPILVALASKSDFGSLAEKLFPSAQPKTEQTQAVPVRITGKSTELAEGINTEADV